MQRTRRTRATKQLLATRAIGSLIEALRRYGVEEEHLQIAVRQCFRPPTRATTKSLAIDPAKDSSIIGTALAMWYRDPEFLDADGQPMPLRLKASKPSLVSLLAKAQVAVPVGTAVNLMKRARVIRRTSDDSYVPVRRSARMPEVNSLLVEHLAQGVLKLIQTSTYNYSTAGRRAPLFEQSARVRHLPKSFADDYRRFINAQGAAFVTRVDDWLETRAVTRRSSARRPARESTIPAGIYAFAFME